VKNAWELTSQKYKTQLEEIYDNINQNRMNEYNKLTKKMRSESKKKLLHTRMFLNQLTKEEYVNEYLQWHKDCVLNAIEDKKPIPTEVLKEYNFERM